MVILFVGLEERIERDAAEVAAVYGHKTTREPSVEAALEGIAHRLSNVALPDLFVLGRLGPVAAMVAARAIRAHPLTREDGILIVDDGLRDDEAAAIVEAGADDCYIRRFQPAVFSAMMRRVLARHPAARGQAAADPELVRVGPALSLHLVRKSVTLDGGAVELSGLQFELLAALARRLNCPVPSPELLGLLRRRVLYATEAQLAKELQAVAGKLGRLSALLSRGADGAWTLAEPASPDCRKTT